jgi:hypothetical protein
LTPGHRLRSAGSQPERTRLAWRRTVLVVGVVVLLLARAAVENRAAWLLPVAVAGWLVVALAAQRRITMLVTDARLPVDRALTVLVLVTLGYVATGAAAVLLG